MGTPPHTLPPPWPWKSLGLAPEAWGLGGEWALHPWNLLLALPVATLPYWAARGQRPRALAWSLEAASVLPRSPPGA